MALYAAPDPGLDREYEELVAKLQSSPTDESLKRAANELALKIRSRSMDLTTWKADYSPEYNLRMQQCRTLTAYAGSYAHEFLVKEFRDTERAVVPARALTGQMELIPKPRHSERNVIANKRRI
jgi:hypothetical protein